jgi:hypothetical protein
LVRNAVARFFSGVGERLVVSDRFGVWCLTDNSKGLDELEFVRNSSNVGDSGVVARFLNDLRSNPTTFSDVLRVVSVQAFNQQQSFEMIRMIVRRLGWDDDKS